MDPVELRRRNLLRDGPFGPTGTEMPPGVSLPVVVEPLRRRRPLDRAPPAGRGALALRLPPRARMRSGAAGASPAGSRTWASPSGFPERCEVRLVLHGDDDVDHVELFHAGAEVGQGSHTAFPADGGGGGRRARRTGRGDLLRHRAGRGRRLRLGLPADVPCPATPSSAPRRRPGEAVAGRRSPCRSATSATSRRPPSPSMPSTAWSPPTSPTPTVLRAVALTVDIGTGHIVVDEVVTARSTPAGPSTRPGQRPDRGWGRPGPRLRHHRGPPGARRPDPQPRASPPTSCPGS